MKETLKPGLRHELRFTVSDAKTVPALYPEADEFLAMPAVFATGFMVGLLEWACVRVINPHLDMPAELSLGTGIDVTHEAATPPGLTVTVEAELVEVDRRRLVFQVQAHDGVDVIARGTHERVVVDRARFEAGVAKKKAAAAAGGSTV